MAGAWIGTGNDTPRLQSRLRNAVQQLAFAVEEIQAIANIQSQLVGASPQASDYAALEAAFGITPLSGSTGTNGSAVSAIVGSANTTLQGSFIQGLIQRLG